MQQVHDMAGRRAVVKGGLAMAGVLALPGTVGAAQRLSLDLSKPAPPRASVPAH